MVTSRRWSGARRTYAMHAGLGGPRPTSSTRRWKEEGSGDLEGGATDLRSESMLRFEAQGTRARSWGGHDGRAARLRLGGAQRRKRQPDRGRRGRSGCLREPSAHCEGRAVAVPRGSFLGHRRASRADGRGNVPHFGLARSAAHDAEHRLGVAHGRSRRGAAPAAPPGTCPTRAVSARSLRRARYRGRNAGRVRAGPGPPHRSASVRRRRGPLPRPPIAADRPGTRLPRDSPPHLRCAPRGARPPARVARLVGRRRRLCRLDWIRLRCRPALSHADRTDDWRRLADRGQSAPYVHGAFARTSDRRPHGRGHLAGLGWRPATAPSVAGNLDPRPPGARGRARVDCPRYRARHPARRCQHDEPRGPGGSRLPDGHGRCPEPCGTRAALLRSTVVGDLVHLGRRTHFGRRGRTHRDVQRGCREDLRLLEGGGHREPPRPAAPRTLSLGSSPTPCPIRGG